MFTEIEWWGGLLLVWMTLTCGFVRKDYRGAGKLFVYLAFASTCFVLALYFYVLDNVLLKRFYVGIVAVAIISSALAVFRTDKEDASEAKEEEEDEEGENVSSTLVAVAGVVLFFPVLASLVLGVYKAIEIIDSL